MICIVVAKDSIPQTVIVKKKVFGAWPRFCLNSRKVVIIALVTLDNCHVAPKASGEPYDKDMRTACFVSEKTAFVP